MRIIEDEGLLENTIAMGDYTLGKLGELMGKHRVIGDVRGKGCSWGPNWWPTGRPRNRRPREMVQAVVADCMAQGVIIGATNRSIPGLNNTLCLSPALICTKDDIDEITGAMDRALTKVFG